jgi:hypothetical protein
MAFSFNKEVRKHLASTADKLSWLGGAGAGVFGLTTDQHLGLTLLVMVLTWFLGQCLSVWLLGYKRNQKHDTS